MTQTYKPLAEGLFEDSDNGLVLIGSKCRESGRVQFPAVQGPDAQQFDRVFLPQRGTLWTYTVQRFRPKPPYNDGRPQDAPFTPFAVGYVQLDDSIVVETRLRASSFDDLSIGMRMKLVPEILREERGGECVVTYAFSPE